MPQNSKKIASFLLIWIIELVLLLGCVYFWFYISIYSINVNESGFYNAKNTDGLKLFYLWLFYVPYSLFTHYNHQKNNTKPRIALLIAHIKEKNKQTSIKQLVLTFGVKLFFIPLMYLGMLDIGVNLLEFSKINDNHLFQASNFIEWFNFICFPIIVYLSLFIALVIYFIGYVFESKKLKTQIISVDNSLIGWIVCLICYVPFYPFIAYVIPNASQDFAFFKSHEITFVVRILLSIILVFKTITIFNLGLKSSNLTYRGIVTHGMYSWVRHPHYACKLAIWWIGLMPSAYAQPWLIGPMVFWTVIYYLRALTEEQHLAQQNQDYIAYQNQVKYLFIPGIV